MALLSRIGNFFGKRNKPLDMSLETYAALPLLALIEGSAPFNDWRAPAVKIPQGLYGAFRAFVWMYQMYAFYILTARRFGYDIADKVIQLQVDRLQRASSDLGTDVTLAIRQIHRTVVQQIEEPFFIEARGEKSQVPVEYAVALEFLTTGKDAPFPATEEDVRRGIAPDFGGADLDLAECLAHGAQTANAFFRPLTDQATVRL